MKSSKLVLGMVLLITALPFTALSKNGTISTTRVGTISTTRTGTISTTATGTVSPTRTGTISTTRTSLVTVPSPLFNRTQALELLVSMLTAW